MDEYTTTQQIINFLLLMGGGFLFFYALSWCALGAGWCLAWLLGWVPKDKPDNERRVN